jgi:hypothetical protein
MGSSRQALEQLLRPADIDLAPLTEQEVDRLLELVDTARRSQRVTLHSGLENTIDELPRLVRGPARKIVFG